MTQNGSIPQQQFTYAPIKQLSFQSLKEEVEKIGTELDNRSLAGANWTLARSEEISIFEKMKQIGVPLGEYVKSGIYRGVLTGLNEAFVINRATRDRLIAEDPKSAEIIKPFIVGDDVRKYRTNFRGRYLIFTRRGTNIKNYPAIEQHLSRFKECLIPKPKDWKGSEWKGRKPGPYQWYEIQDSVDYYPKFERPKIIYPDIAKESRATFDSHGLYIANTAYLISTDNLYLLGLLNSKLLFTYYKRSATVLGDADRGGRLRWIRQDVVKLPIHSINFNNPADKIRHDRMVQLVERMLSLNNQLATARTSHDQTILQRQIDGTDRQIDRLVYELYELTDKEIAIVEETTH